MKTLYTDISTIISTSTEIESVVLDFPQNLNSHVKEYPLLFLMPNKYNYAKNDTITRKTFQDVNFYLMTTLNQKSWNDRLDAWDLLTTYMANFWDSFNEEFCRKYRIEDLSLITASYGGLTGDVNLWVEQKATITRYA